MILLKFNNVDVYLTICLKTNKCNGTEYVLSLAGLDEIYFSQVMMPNISPGQFVIIAFDENKKHSIYILDQKNCPFQVVGTRDLLLDACFYTDLTREFNRTIFDIQFILKQMFLELTVQEMIDCSYLSDWELAVKELAIPEKYDFEEMILLCQNSLKSLPDVVACNKLREKLKVIKKPKNKYSHEQYVDWGDYFIKSQTTKVATD